MQPEYSQTTNGVLHLNMTPAERFAKRAIDAGISLSALLLLSPLLVMLCLLLMVGGGCRVFYRQERLGRNGKPFQILKFRTMRVDAETNGPQLEVPNDPRLTRIGSFLRRHHLDELPQLWNVLVGDMAIVGPRPERPYFVKQIMARDGRYRDLFQLRPGLTSEATLYNGYTTTMDKMLQRLELDLRYLSRASLLLDCQIVFKTFLLVVRGDQSTPKQQATSKTNSSINNHAHR